MASGIEQLVESGVAELMRQPVVTISANASMGETARTLIERGISGAPVVDEMGRCVGILSTTDFARRDQVNEDQVAGPVGNTVETFTTTSHGTLAIEHIVDDRVHQHMTTAVQTIGAERSLLEAARYMTTSHISRLVVVDRAARPVGILSALDILEALVRACDQDGDSDQPAD